MPKIKHYIDYIRHFISAPRTFGSLAPSSAWLCNRMAGLANWQQVSIVAELGAGGGVMTCRLLDKLALGAELDAYEINPSLVNHLHNLAINDARLNVIAHSAEKLNRNYDLIFSSLPLLSLPIKSRVRILRQINKRLNPDGVLILFQYSSMLEKQLSRYFEWSKVYEVRNFPPAWIYVCKLACSRPSRRSCPK